MADDATPARGSPEPRVLMTVVYDSGMEERVAETLAQLRLPGWTKTFGGQGFGGTGRKENTAIWPGTVNVVTIALPEEEVETVAAVLRELQSTYRRNPGLTIWTHPITVW